MGFPRQEYWSGLPFPPPGGLPNPGIEPASPVSPALAGRFFFFFFTSEPPGKTLQVLLATKTPQFAWDSVTKYHRLGGFNNTNLLFSLSLFFLL